MDLERDQDWPSTKGLSVYNALSFTGRDMCAAEIRRFLCDTWAPVSQQYVLDGIGFLLSKQWVNMDGETVRLLRRGVDRRGRKVMRTKNKADLAMVGF